MQLSWEFGAGLFRLDLFAVFDASPRTFIKSNIFPEAISFNFAEQEESVESPQEKHDFTTKRDISISRDKIVFQHHLFQT